MEHSGSSLSWLSAILWPQGDARLLIDRRRNRSGGNQAYVIAGGDDDYSVGFRWWASPSPQSAEILVPATSMAAARAAVRRYHDGYTLRRRARSWAAELLMRWPAAADRVLDANLVAATGRVEDGLLTELAASLAETEPISELHVAVTLSRPKSNRKPVLQLIDENGVCVGWAKVGWNHWTKDLVANEADWLRRRPAGALVMPRVLAQRNLRGHLVVVTSAVTAGRRPRRVATQPAPELLAAIADLGRRGRMVLADTPWWRSVLSVLHLADDNERRAIEEVARSVGSASIEVGAWHGDLTPWNIMSSGPGAGPTVIDWEFAADGVPLGFDLCHFHTQVGTEMKKLTARQALNRSARLSPQGLAQLGVDPHNQINVYRLYLVELIRRTLALRAAGMATDQVEQGRAAAERLGAAPVPDRRGLERSRR